MVFKKLVCVDLGSAFNPPKRDGGIDQEAIKTISDQFEEICELGFKIVAFVGPGGLGDEYVGVAQRFTKKKNELRSIEQRTSQVNALLFVDVLLRRGLRSRSKPFESGEELEDFIRRSREWDVLVAGSVGSRKAIEILARKIRAKPFITISEKAISEAKGNFKRSQKLVTTNGNILRVLAAR
jgi:uridylate kinase